MIYELVLRNEVVDRESFQNLEEAKLFFMKRKQLTEKQFDLIGYFVRLVKPKIRE